MMTQAQPLIGGTRPQLLTPFLDPLVGERVPCRSANVFIGICHKEHIEAGTEASIQFIIHAGDCSSRKSKPFLRHMNFK